MHARESRGTELVMKEPSKGGGLRPSTLQKQASWHRERVARYERQSIPRTIFVDLPATERSQEETLLLFYVL